MEASLGAKRKSGIAETVSYVKKHRQLYLLLLLKKLGFEPHYFMIAPKAFRSIYVISEI